MFCVRVDGEKKRAAPLAAERRLTQANITALENNQPTNKTTTPPTNSGGPVRPSGAVLRPRLALLPRRRLPRPDGRHPRPHPLRDLPPARGAPPDAARAQVRDRPDRRSDAARRARRRAGADGRRRPGRAPARAGFSGGFVFGLVLVFCCIPLTHWLTLTHKHKTTNKKNPKNKMPPPAFPGNFESKNQACLIQEDLKRVVTPLGAPGAWVAR